MMLVAFSSAGEGVAVAGQSLVLTPGVKIGPVPNANMADSQSWRVEFQLHSWTLPGVMTNDSLLWGMNGIGADLALDAMNELRIFDKRDSVAGGSPCALSLAGLSNVLVRVQRDTSKMRLVCELWDSSGLNYRQDSKAILSTLQWPYADGQFGSDYTTAQLGFFRIYNTVLPDASRPPVTADIGNVMDLKFDGNLNDSSPAGNCSMTSTTAKYSATPGLVPTAFLKTDNAPWWSSWVSLRAGKPATLDGTSSFSLADTSSSVTYKWSQVSGPTTVTWSATNVGKPVVRGLVFGTYRFQLVVTDVTGKTATSSLDVGAVATDDNGVVVQANPAADTLFGPMIAFGRNPWPWQDQMALHASTVRAPQLAAMSPPSWSTNLSGTVSYTPAWASQSAQTSLAAPLNATDMTIQVANASKLDLTSLPTMVMVINPGGWNYYEEMRICSASGNLLTVCYDGRAWHAGQYQEVPSPQAWATGSTLYQIKTTGSSTKFLTDFCPAGVGEEGQIIYSAGTVGVTPGSAALTGTGTNWTGSLQSLRVRIQGTHAGKAFVFFAGIANVNSPTSITLTRIWPADADRSTRLTYAVLQSSRAIVRRWVRPDGTSGQQSEGISSCESNTRIYHANIFSAIIGQQTGQTYSYSNSYWFSEFGPNYYDEVLGEYANYFRSGYSLFLTNARTIGDYWPKAPEFDEGWNGMMPRRVGATGMTAAAVLDGRTSNWTSLRKLAGTAVNDIRVMSVPNAVTNPDPCDADLRETAYELSWISLAGLFDPLDTGSTTQTGQRSFWKAQLSNSFLRDSACKGPNNEFPTTYWASTGAYTMTQGSATVKGSSLSPAICNVATSGTLTVANGSKLVSGNGFTPAAKIVIMSQRLGQPYLFYSLFTVNPDSSITLATTFDGDTGTWPYQIENDTYWLSFATYADSPGNLDKFHKDVNTLYACRWIDDSTIQLDRPWASAGGVYGGYRYLEVGYGTQPFLAGIKTFAMKLASQAATGPAASGYAALANSTASWILSTGFDPATGGLHYAREWAGCEPNANPRLNCTYATDPNSRQSARFLNGEAQNAMRVAYQANPTASNKDFGDRFYGAQWGKLGGPWSDDVYLSNLENDNSWNYKWFGFLFGIGMSHQWPAVRLGGVMPAVPVQYSVNLNFTENSRQAKVLVTQPSGATTTVTCSSSPCSFTVDKRQGDHWYQVTYLSSSGKTVSTSSSALLQVQ